MQKNVYTFNLDHDIYMYEWTCTKMYIHVHLIWTMTSMNGHAEKCIYI